MAVSSFNPVQSPAPIDLMYILNPSNSGVAKRSIKFKIGQCAHPETIIHTAVILSILPSTFLRTLAPKGEEGNRKLRAILIAHNR